MLTPAKFGSISSGTLRTEDLIDTLAGELQWLTQAGRNDRSTAETALLAECDAWSAAEDEESRAAFCAAHDHPADMFDEYGANLVGDLCEALEAYAPAYGYFGAHPGDGADFGFWLSEDWQEAFDGLQVDDTSEVPADYSGEVLHVNDHGNATLYAKDEGKVELREIWSVV